MSPGKSLIDHIITEISPERMKNETLRYFEILDQNEDIQIDVERGKHMRINKNISVDILVGSIRLDDEEMWPFRILVRVNSVAARDDLASESKFLLYLNSNLDISTCDFPHIEQEEDIQHLN